MWKIKANDRVYHYLMNFDISLTVHLSITLANDQLDAQILIHLL